MLPRCATIPVADCLLVLDQLTGRLLVLNPTAALTWTDFQQGLNAAEIAGRLADAFAVTADLVRPDVETALNEWDALDLFADLTATPAVSPEVIPVRPSNFPAPTTWHAASEYTYCLMGRDVRIRYQDLDLEAGVHPCLAHLQTADSEQVVPLIDVYREAAGFVVSSSGLSAIHDSLFDRIKTVVVGQLILQSVPNPADLFAILHSGAIGNGNECILLPGASGSGKSTLTAALVHAGFTYFSDDFVPFDLSRHQAIPCPVAFSIKRGSWDLLSGRFPALRNATTYYHSQRHVRYFVPPANSCQSPGAGNVVGAIVFPKYRQDAACKLESISAADALQRLLLTNSWLKPPLRADSIEQFVRWIEGVPCQELIFSSLPDAVATISENVFSK